MRALVTTEHGIALEERAAPVPAPHEVLVDVVYAGVCRTDLAVADGTIEVARGRVIGHELAGRVAAIGDAARERIRFVETPSGLQSWRPRVAIGDPVSVIPFVRCGACAACKRALPARCFGEQWLGIDRDGAFADQICVPAPTLLRLPPAIPLLRGAFVEPVAAALGVLSMIRRGDRVLVDGDSRIAELAARILVAHGAEVSREASPASFDTVVETSTCADVSPLLDALRPGGTLVLKSRARRSVAVPAGQVVARDLTIRGASHGSFAQAVEWLHEARIDVDDLLDPPRPLEAFADVFTAARGETRKQMFAVDVGGR